MSLVSRKAEILPLVRRYPIKTPKPLHKRQFGVMKQVPAVTEV